MVDARHKDPPVRLNDDEVTPEDYEAAEEIARFIAERAFAFEDHECRAWALTDFEVWASLAGRDAALALVPRDPDPPGPEGES